MELLSIEPVFSMFGFLCTIPSVQEYLSNPASWFQVGSTITVTSMRNWLEFTSTRFCTRNLRVLNSVGTMSAWALPAKHRASTAASRRVNSILCVKPHVKLESAEASAQKLSIAKTKMKTFIFILCFWKIKFFKKKRRDLKNIEITFHDVFQINIDVRCYKMGSRNKIRHHYPHNQKLVSIYVTASEPWVQ